MKTLKTLIKLRKKELDDLLLQINKAEITKEQLEKELNNMLEQAKREKKLFYATEYANMLEEYIQHTRNQEKIYNSKISDIVENIKTFREKLFVLFTELKKLDIVLERRKAAEKEKERLQEDRERDELTTLRYKKPTKS